MSQRDELDKHRAAEQRADDSSNTPTLPVERQHPLPQFFQIRDLGREFGCRVVAYAGAAGEEFGRWQRSDPFEGGDDFPHIVPGAQGAIPPAHEQVAAEEPAPLRLVQTDVVEAVAGGVDHLEAVVLGPDHLAVGDGLGLGRLGPAPHDTPV